MLMIFGGIFCYCKKNPNGQKTKIPDRSHPEETRTSHITTLENFDTMQENMAYDTENVVYDDTLLDSTTNTQPITPATNEVQSTIYESIDEACIDDTDMEQVELPKHSITTKT